MKSRVLTYSIVVVLFCSLWFFLVFLPLYKERKKYTSEITAVKNQRAEFDKLMDELPEYVRTGRDLEQKKKALKSSLLVKEEILKLLDRLDRQARREKLVITEISPPIEELLQINNIIPDSDQPQYLSINLKLHGGYLDFGRFVEEVEQSEYFRRIRDCKIIGHRSDREELILQISFEVLLGYQGETT